MTLKLYGLAMDDGALISPYVWRSRFALAKKGMEPEVVGLGFTDIPGLQGGAFKSVPVLEDGETWVGDSWAIADHLETAYRDRPALFGAAGERAMAKLFERQLAVTAANTLFRIALLDIYARLRPADRDYFRKSREARIGGTMEAFAHDREQHLPLLRKALSPIRATVAETPFLAGDQPNYADFIGVSLFLWAGSVSTLPLLAADDPVAAWVLRGRELYGGLGRELNLPGLSEAA